MTNLTHILYDVYKVKKNEDTHIYLRHLLKI